MRSRQELVSGYLRTYKSKSDEACETDEQLAYIAAGPIDDFLGSGFPRFAEACKDSAKVLRAMRMLAWDETDPMYPQLKSLLMEHGVWDVK